jgi:hypothetical protein
VAAFAAVFAGFVCFVAVAFEAVAFAAGFDAGFVAVAFEAAFDAAGFGAAFDAGFVAGRSAAAASAFVGLRVVVLVGTLSSSSHRP